MLIDLSTPYNNGEVDVLSVMWPNVCCLHLLLRLVAVNNVQCYSTIVYHSRYNNELVTADC